MSSVTKLTPSDQVKKAKEIDKLGLELENPVTINNQKYQVTVLIRVKNNNTYEFLDFKNGDQAKTNALAKKIETQVKDFLNNLKQTSSNIDFDHVDYIDQKSIHLLSKKNSSNPSILVPTDEKTKKCWKKFSDTIVDIYVVNEIFKQQQRNASHLLDSILSKPTIRQAKRTYVPSNKNKATLPHGLKRGLTNNCYVIASTQLLASIPENVLHTQNSLSALNNFRKKGTSPSPKFVENMKKLGWNNASNANSPNQQDAQEFLSKFLEATENPNTKSHPLYFNLINTKQYSVKKRCKYENATQFPGSFLKISKPQLHGSIMFPIEQKDATLEDLFKSYCSCKKRFDSNNHTIDQGNVKGALEIQSEQVQFKNPQDHILFSVKRFTSSGGKNYTPLKINPTFSIKQKYIQNQKQDVRYQIQAFIHHEGTSASGHYTAFRLIDGIWYEFNDDKVTPIYNKHYLQQKLNTAYIYYAKRLNETVQQTRMKKTIPGTYRVNVEKGNLNNKPHQPIEVSIANIFHLNLTKEDLPHIFHWINHTTFDVNYPGTKNTNPVNNPAPRANHNGTQAVRQAKHTQEILKELKKAKKSPFTEKEELNLMLAAYCLRSGRINEGSHISKDPYNKRSAQIYQEYAQQLGIDPKMIQWTQNVISYWPKKSNEAIAFKKNQKNQLACKIVATGHELDLVRCKNQTEFDPNNINQKSIYHKIQKRFQLLFQETAQNAANRTAKYIKSAQNLCKATGYASLQSETNQKSTYNNNTFITNSKNGLSCWNAVSRQNIN